jgi:hypothetical protein
MSMRRRRIVVLIAFVSALEIGPALAQCPTEVVFAEDFEGGVLPAQWKTSSPLWNVVANSSCANTCQQGFFLLGGAKTINANKCTCKTDTAMSCGSVTVYSPMIQLPEIGAGEHLLLEFCFDGLLDTAYGYCNRLEIEHPAGESFKLGPHKYYPCPGPETLPPYDLTRYAGETIRLGWYLGLMDEGGVAFLKIDNVRILRTRPSWPDDCNDNGMPDACETVLGHVPDCNDNLVPDACDLASGLAPDCNRNGVPDGCDVDAGTSTDLDDNGIPDDCQCLLETYCPPAPNSAASAGAQISSTGPTSISANELKIQLTLAPKSQLAMLIAGPPAARVPFHDGWMCLGQPVLNFPPKKTNGVNGTLTISLDFASPPADALLPLVEVGFQFWFRDPQAGLAGANLSEGLRAILCP